MNISQMILEISIVYYHPLRSKASLNLIPSRLSRSIIRKFSCFSRLYNPLFHLDFVSIFSFFLTHAIKLV